MPDRLEISFNSKLVRLKVTLDNTSGRDLFQFQIGAIKSTTGVTSVTSFSYCFNSKLVRLKDDCEEHFGSVIGFNSKLVRLKDIRVGDTLCIDTCKFQFQIGAIKRMSLRR